MSEPRKRPTIPRPDLSSADVIEVARVAARAAVELAEERGMQNGSGSGSGSGSGAAWTSDLVLEHLRTLIAANDKRYVELFTSSEKAVATAFVASEKATAAAFSASEKAIRDALAAVEKSTAAAFVAAEKAVALAEANAERWRQDAQEWRARMTDREKAFAPADAVATLKERLDRGSGRDNGVGLAWAVGVAVAGLGIAILGLLGIGRVK